MDSRKVIGSGQHGFMKGKSCLSSMISFHDEMTGLVDERRAVNLVCLDFIKVFYTVYYNLLTDKLMK